MTLLNNNNVSNKVQKLRLQSTTQKKLELKEKEVAEKPQKDELFNYAMNIASSKEKLKTINKINVEIQPKVTLVYLKNGITEPKEFNKIFDENILAKDKNELKTIITVLRTARAKGRYTDGSSGTQYSYTITIIDVTQNVIIATQVINGSEPPSSKSKNIPATGSDPTYEVERYLKSIPIVGKQ